MPSREEEKEKLQQRSSTGQREEDLTTPFALETGAAEHPHGGPRSERWI
jgi:hypothetical protein